MRIEVTPRQANVTPGVPQTVTITVANTSTVIGGYEIRILGADPTWVKLDTSQVSMFPDESRTLTAQITVPTGVPAGVRRIAVQVRELTPPHSTAIAEIDLSVPSARAVLARLDPLAVTGGRKGQFSVLVENRGNTLLRAELAAEDPEGKVRFRFLPEIIALAPGEHAVVDMVARGKRPLAGSPSPRTVSVYLDELPEDGFFAQPPAAPPKHDEKRAAATGMFIQRSLLSRGSMSLFGLIAAVTVFAIIITIAMSRLVGTSAADRNLALQVVAAQASNAANSGTSGLSGDVRLLTSGKPVSGVSVAVYLASDTSQPVATTATNASGGYVVTNLNAGQYKITFRGASFLQLWYPGAASPGDAASVRLGVGQIHTGLDVTVGGIPATINGTVSGGDLTGATLYLEKTVRNDSAGGNSTVVPVPQPGQVSAPPNNGDAIVKTIPIGSDGSFSLTDVPSPSRYILVLAKPGYATSTQTIDVAAGEIRNSVALTLRQGDGVIAGTITSASGALGGATISATTGSISASTVSLTDNPPGSFTLRNLPTPGTYTIVATKDGFASQSMTLTLSAGQKLTGVSITLGKSSGTLSGSASLIQPDHSADTPAAGVSVIVTDGSLTVQTETNSKPMGSWTVGGLPIPGTYTVTFTRPDLATQTVSVSLDSAGNITQGSQGTTVTSNGIAVRLRSATGSVYGTVNQPGGAHQCNSADDVGEAVVTLSSGASTYTVNSASVPQNRCGQYEIDSVPPGTYTLTVQAGSGTIPESHVVRVSSGVRQLQNVTLGRPASIIGTVDDVSTTTDSGCTLTVFLYLAATYPNTVTATTTTGKISGQSGCNNFTFPRVDAGTYIIAVSSSPNPVNTLGTVTVFVQPGEQYGTAADKTAPFVIKVNPGG